MTFGRPSRSSSVLCGASGTEDYLLLGGEPRPADQCSNHESKDHDSINDAIGQQAEGSHSRAAGVLHARRVPQKPTEKVTVKNHILHPWPLPSSRNLRLYGVRKSPGERNF